MTSFDFNTAPAQQERGALIPNNTVAVVLATLRPGGHGAGGWLRASANNSLNNMLDFEFTVVGGEFDRRKFWGLMHYVDASPDALDEKQSKSAASSRSMIRAMLESAFSVNPDDMSPAAMAKRQVAGWQSFDGIKFCAKIGIELGALKDKMAGPDSERYPDKNKLVAIITPGDMRYLTPGPQSAAAVSVGDAVQSAARAVGGGTAQAVAAVKPAWAQ